MKKKIRLTESDLHRIIKESVKTIIMEQVGVKDIFDSSFYPIFIYANEDDFIDEEITKGDENRYRAYCKWANEVNFYPILLGRLGGTYDDCYILGPDDDSEAALEYELSKLDNCPVFNENEIQRIKDYIREEIDSSLGDNNWENVDWEIAD